jgi:DNA recombination-dependent growth factor C
MALRTPPGGVKGFATRAARAAHAGPKAAAHAIASHAVYTCCLPRKAELSSGAEMSSVMTAHVSCGKVSQAFLAILEPEMKGWADSGVSQVVRGQDHQTKGWIQDGRNKC